MADEGQERPGQPNGQSDVIEGGDVRRADEELPFHPLKHRAETASSLAHRFVHIFAAGLAVHYVAVATLSSFGLTEAADALGKAFNAWLPVLSGFVGSAATYYFTRDRT